MARVLDEFYMNGDFGDEDVSNPVWSEGMARYGRRILGWTSHGFHWYQRFPTVADAEVFFAANVDMYEGTATEELV